MGPTLGGMSSRPAARPGGRAPSRVPARLQALAAGAVVLSVVAAALTGLDGRGVPPVEARWAASATSTAAPSHTFRQLTSDAQLRTGTAEAVSVAGGSARLVPSSSRPAGTTTYAGRTWSWGRWTSPVSTPARAFDELVPSWSAETPANTFVRVLARVTSTTGRTSGWKVMGNWSHRDTTFRRTSAGAQRDAVASVATDTLRAAPGTTLRSYQLRVTLFRAAGSTATPALRSVQAVASRAGATQPTSRPLLGARTLAVPAYSQMTHRGEYPQYGGGGQAWCSPTSLSMLLGYYGRLPAPGSYAWVAAGDTDRFVDHVARTVYDHGYRGAGNWAFNTAYAANRTGDAFVTRLSSLRDAERFVAAGVPLAASISFSRGGLTGAPIGATAGHLVVIAGFTRTGDVVVNDPAASTNAGVRRTYDRGQFERAWQSGSRGTVYVVHDAAHPLPAGF